MDTGVVRGGAYCEDEGGGLESEELAGSFEAKAWLPSVMIIIFP